MRMKKLKKSEIILISVVLTVLVGYLYYTLILKGILDEKSMVKSNIQSKTEELEQLKLVRKSNKNKQDKYEELQKEAEKYVDLITKSDRVPQISYDLKKYIEKHQLFITTLKFEEGESLELTLNSENTDEDKKGKKSGKNEKGDVFDGIRSINVTLTLEGDYKNVRNMLDGLEDDERLIFINSINISGKGDGTTLVTSNIELSYFSKAEFEENIDYEFNNGKYGLEEMFR